MFRTQKEYSLFVRPAYSVKFPRPCQAFYFLGVGQFPITALSIPNECHYFFESSPLKWLSTSSRLSGFFALVKTTE
jgi:hypothetical protein